MPRIDHLLALIAALPPEIATICGRIFRISAAHGRLEPPDAMQDWIARHFGAGDAANDQRIIKVANRLTLEATLFNPLRARRPADDSADADLEHTIAANLAAGDIFHDPLADTPADRFGRIRGEHCVTASNIAKYDGWHGVVIFDEPHPLRFGSEQVRDYLQTAWRWLQAAHSLDPAARYPIITWNCLWKSGASIIHGHIQMALATDGPYAAIERWQQAARSYRNAYGDDYFAALRAVHRALGLVFVERDGATGYATLTPFKNNEVLLTAPVDLHDPFPAALADATYAALRGLIDGQGMRSFNLAVYPPPFDPLDNDWQAMPWCVRIVDRGNPASRMVDVGAMELFGTSVVSADPFALAEALRGMRLEA